MHFVCQCPNEAIVAELEKRLRMADTTHDGLPCLEHQYALRIKELKANWQDSEKTVEALAEQVADLNAGCVELERERISQGAHVARLELALAGAKADLDAVREDFANVRARLDDERINHGVTRQSLRHSDAEVAMLRASKKMGEAGVLELTRRLEAASARLGEAERLASAVDDWLTREHGTQSYSVASALEDALAAFRGHDAETKDQP